MQYIHFIVNPISGKGNHKITKAILLNYFSADLYQIEIDYSSYKKHAIELAKQSVLKQPDVIVACGGDGTINEVASALVGTKIPLGILPVGSGNGLASNLNISKEIDTALKIIKNRKQSSIDVGKINDIYFFSNMGLGIDSLIIKKYENFPTRNLYSYVKASLQSALEYKPKPTLLSINGIEQELLPFLLFISNSNEMGYKMSLTPKASLSDGLLNLIAVPKTNFLEKLYFGSLVVLRKTENFKKAQIHLIEQLTISLPDHTKVELQIDGEFYCIDKNTIEVKVLPNSLYVITD